MAARPAVTRRKERGFTPTETFNSGTTKNGRSTLKYLAQFDGDPDIEPGGADADIQLPSPGEAKASKVGKVKCRPYPDSGEVKSAKSAKVKCRPNPDSEGDKVSNVGKAKRRPTRRKGKYLVPNAGEEISSKDKETVSKFPFREVRWECYFATTMRPESAFEVSSQVCRFKAQPMIEAVKAAIRIVEYEWYAPPWNYVGNRPNDGHTPQRSV